MLSFFASPLMLWGLALGGLPVLIHLLNKRKFRETQWAAMQFLLEAVRKNSRRIRFEQLVLLALRTLLLLLLVLALARPHFADFGGYFAADLPVHKIIVVDTSFSMAFDTNGNSGFERARELARRVAEDARQGDALNLVRISGAEPRVIVSQPAFQADQVVAEIDQLTLTHERGDLFPTIREVSQLLQAALEIPQKEVYFISDFQRVSWVPEAASKPAEIRGLLREIGDRAQIIMLDVGQASSSNSAVAGFEAAEPFITVDRPARFKAALTTYGTTPLPGQLIEFLVDGRLQEQLPLDLQPGTETVAWFSHTFASGGEHQLEVRLPGDRLGIDDQRRLVVSVLEEIKVLCVNGKLAGDPQQTATYHLALALDPAGRDAQHVSLIRPKVIKYGELRGVNLNDYDCVFLCNVSTFDAVELQLLESYLQGGGGVVWSLGDRVRPDDYNRLLYRDGRGILPARIAGRVGNAAGGEQSFTFDPLEFTHPLINAFQGNPDAGLETTRTAEYLRVVPPENGESRVALAFDNGDPAIVEATVGAGKAVLITTAVDDSWGNWALWPSFLPMMQEIVVYAISGRSRDRDLLVDEPLSRTLQTRGADVSATILRPDRQPEEMRSIPSATLTTFTYHKTDLSGFYTAEFGHPLSRTETFAVNVDPRESNLQKLEREDLDRDLLPGTKFEYQTDWEERERRAHRPTAERGGATRWLLYATLYLLFVEQVMAWNFVYGLWLLIPPLMPLNWLLSRYRTAG